MSKYYTPSLKEFHVGFEFEYSHLELGHFFKDVYILDWKHFDMDIEEMLNSPAFIRVKYLDKQDIESFGFKQHDKLYYQFYKNNFLLIDREDNNYTIIDNTDNYVLFYGIIKNKSELKKLLKQLSIE